MTASRCCHDEKHVSKTPCYAAAHTCMTGQDRSVPVKIIGRGSQCRARGRGSFSHLCKAILWGKGRQGQALLLHGVPQGLEALLTLPKVGLHTSKAVQSTVNAGFWVQADSVTATNSSQADVVSQQAARLVQLWLPSHSTHTTIAPTNIMTDSVFRLY